MLQAEYQSHPLALSQSVAIRSFRFTPRLGTSAVIIKTRYIPDFSGISEIHAAGVLAVLARPNADWLALCSLIYCHFGLLQ